jgi:dTDP-4-dehydrorhamnose 3,5-epimerase
MQFTSLPLSGAYLISLEPRVDGRGSFARTYCSQEFADHGMNFEIKQTNICYNNEAGIVRGMHFQRAPHAETKLVRCIRGSIFDVIVDLREDSTTFGQVYCVELTEANGLLLVVPEGFAHGYQVLEAGSTVSYMVSSEYSPHAEAGLRYDDPALNIKWPLPVGDVSEKDARWPSLKTKAEKL